MKKTTYEKWCTAFVKNLSEHFNLAGWRVRLKFSATPKESEERESEGCCWAEISSDAIYMQATITTYPKMKQTWKDGDVNRVVEALVHEFCHVLLDPMHEHALPFLSDSTRPMFSKMLENTTQRINAVVLNGLPKSLIPPR